MLLLIILLCCCRRWRLLRISQWGRRGLGSSDGPARGVVVYLAGGLRRAPRTP